MTELSLSAITRIAKNAGVERVGKDAEEILAKMAEDFIANLATEAFKYAKHAGRVTIKTEDLRVIDGRNYNIRVP
ncbi:MAG TPA: NFYB/HAP3 family transcription factor subunit [Methanocorpusculum sp.]|nr:NFYB/HAP3 family transcription factor subunit [Methanocorpusculum sp.]HJJ40341.1 NFYB/HAP3 family transcription factor subunit [Methanocorpusculum sp.]HJJ49742.1 NFYB/HAP3 family transcription factor subunit [Methanocorpusculum sp.]HJJ57574.1 NFYB/HAP3 family transcription factor subunit [Methanocorpusculum sp.]HJJ95922.1 NFYB/HAP3 family transcription factor subunit [Methanocorpusculum sp.]